MAVQRSVGKIQGVVKGVLGELEEAVERHGKLGRKGALLLECLTILLCCLTKSVSPATRELSSVSFCETRLPPGREGFGDRYKFCGELRFIVKSIPSKHVAQRAIISLGLLFY